MLISVLMVMFIIAAAVAAYQIGYHRGYSDSEWKWILSKLDGMIKAKK